MTLTLLVNIVDGGKVIHVCQQHCGFDNCRKQGQRFPPLNFRVIESKCNTVQTADFSHHSHNHIQQL